MGLGKLRTQDDLLICTACGAQYETTLSAETSRANAVNKGEEEEEEEVFIPASETELASCRICDDPRQYVPATGQRFTTLGRMKRAVMDGGEGAKKRYKNVFRQREEDIRVIEMFTEPQFGIGQRACIVRTPKGNVMWDMVAYLDQDTVDKINDLGGLEFIVISHPHFYTTWADWANTFSCPVYMAEVDAMAWANRTAGHPYLKLLHEPVTELLPDLNALILGGHFPGSLVLHSARPNTNIPTLFTADAIMLVPSAQNPDVKKYHNPGKGVVSYTFMWSIPNMIPLDPDAIYSIWKILKDPRWEFESSYSVAPGMMLRAKKEQGETGLRHRVLESMKVFLRKSGVISHPLLKETLPETI